MFLKDLNALLVCRDPNDIFCER